MTPKGANSADDRRSETMNTNQESRSASKPASNPSAKQTAEVGRELAARFGMPSDGCDEVCGAQWKERTVCRHGKTYGVYEEVQSVVPQIVFESYGGGGGIRVEKAGTTGGVHIFDTGCRDDDEGLVFSLGREEAAILARALLKAAGVKA